MRTSGDEWQISLAVAVAALLVVLWALLILAVPELRFVLYVPRAKTGFEVALALLSLFTAAVLALFPDETNVPRLRWVALGFTILGLGGLGFGFIGPLIAPVQDLNTVLYESLLTRVFGGLAMAIGVVPARPPRLPLRSALLALGLIAVAGSSLVLLAPRWPALVDGPAHEARLDVHTTILTGLTGWHWLLSAGTVLIALAAAAGAVRHSPGRAPRGWLAVGMTLMAGSQLHQMFWPGAFSPILTTSSLLRAGFTGEITLGAFFELRRVATERATMAARERAAAVRLTQLAEFRAQFTTMVAHELATPLSAIRRAHELLGLDPLTANQVLASRYIETNLNQLETLVTDVHSASVIDRDDFVVQAMPVPLGLLLDDALASAAGVTRAVDVRCDIVPETRILADPGRVVQVLVNLLTNAAKYGAAGTTITLHVVRTGPSIRIAVTNQGPGIAPDDLPHIFERFGRGTQAARSGIPGAGLGLYVARQLVRAHGHDLMVESNPGTGTTFWFDLDEDS